MHHHLSLRGKLIIMGSVMASLFLVALDQTIIGTALGRIVEEFNAFNSLSWVVTAYLITTTVTVPISGKLSDLFGRRLLLLIGVGIFGIGSLLSGLSGTIEQLIMFRALQGIGGGIITANAFTIVGDLFAARERGRWQGLIGAVFGISSVIGPLLGGWLTDGQAIAGLTTDWRWTFYINVPVAIAAFVLIAIFCPPLKHAAKPRVDYKGAALLTLALVTLVLAVDNTETIFASLLSATGMSLLGLRAIMFSIVIVATALFIRVERRAAQPILPLQLFKSKNFVLIMAIALFFGAAFLGSILYLTQFNQQVFAATPTESGLMLIPMVAGLMVASIGSGQIIARIGRYKWFMVVGAMLATVTIFLLTTLTPDSHYAQEAIIMTLLGMGLGLVMPVMNLAVQNEFSQKELGVATSSTQLFRGLGSTIGTAIFGALLTAGMTTQLAGVEQSAYIKTLEQSPAAQAMGDLSDPNTQLNLNQPDTRKKITEATTASLAKLPEPARSQQLETFKTEQAKYSEQVVSAFSDSLRTLFVTAGGLMLVATILTFFVRERELARSDPSKTPGEA